MKLTLAVIVYWLSVNFDLPRIEHASADKMLELRYQGLATPRAAKAGSLGAYRSVVALYDSSTKTIYLSKKWSSQTPSEMFILVHETSEKLDAFELRVLRFARETVRYQTRRLQELARGFATGLERDVLLEIIGLVAYANGLARLSILLDKC
jgi:hypothetical protein